MKENEDHKLDLSQDGLPFVNRMIDFCYECRYKGCWDSEEGNILDFPNSHSPNDPQDEESQVSLDEMRCEPTLLALLNVPDEELSDEKHKSKRRKTSDPKTDQAALITKSQIDGRLLLNWRMLVLADKYDVGEMIHLAQNNMREAFDWLFDKLMRNQTLEKEASDIHKFAELNIVIGEMYEASFWDDPRYGLSRSPWPNTVWGITKFFDNFMAYEELQDILSHHVAFAKDLMMELAEGKRQERTKGQAKRNGTNISRQWWKQSRQTSRHWQMRDLAVWTR